MACLRVRNRNRREGQKSRVIDDDSSLAWIMFSLRFHWVCNFTVARPRSANICRDYTTDDLVGLTVTHSHSVVAGLCFLPSNLALSSQLPALINFNDDAATPILTRKVVLVTSTRTATVVQVWDDR